MRASLARHTLLRKIYRWIKPKGDFMWFYFNFNNKKLFLEKPPFCASISIRSQRITCTGLAAPQLAHIYEYIRSRRGVEYTHTKRRAWGSNTARYKIRIYMRERNLFSLRTTHTQARTAYTIKSLTRGRTKIAYYIYSFLLRWLCCCCLNFLRCIKWTI